MGIFTIGDVVLVAFPYSDFSRIKMRPAVVVGHAEFNNIVLCQITSKALSSKKALLIQTKDFIDGGLPLDSYVRPDKLFTVEQSIVTRRVGILHNTMVASIRLVIQQLFD